MSAPVTESDCRMPAFRNAKVEDYERRNDGAIVRKDRWETTCRRLASLMGVNEDEDFDCDLLVFSLETFVEVANRAGVEPHYYDELPK